MMDMNKLMGNPMLMAGMGLLSAGRDNRIDPMQKAMQGLLMSGNYQQQQKQNAMQQKMMDMREAESQARIEQAQQQKIAQQQGYLTSQAAVGLLGEGKAREAAQVMATSRDSDLRKAGFGLLMPQTNGPASVQEYQFARQNGFQGSFPEWMQQRGRAGQSYGNTPIYLTDPETGEMRVGRMGPGSQLVEAALPEGLQVAREAPWEARQRDVVASGQTEKAKVIGRTEGERQVGQPQAMAKVRSLTSNIDNIIGTIDEAVPEVGFGTAGFVGSMASNIRGTDAFDLRETIKTVKSNIGFDKLQEMRDLSPTGGALGQVAVQELEGLQATIASLDQGQSPEELKANLLKARQHYARWRDATMQSYQSVYGEDQDSPPPQQAPKRLRYNPATGKLE